MHKQATVYRNTKAFILFLHFHIVYQWIQKANLYFFYYSKFSLLAQTCGQLLWKRALPEFLALLEVALIISVFVLMSLRQYRRFSGGVEGAGSEASGKRPQRSSVSRNHQSGCTAAALVHVSNTACFCSVFAQDPNLTSCPFFHSKANDLLLTYLLFMVSFLVPLCNFLLVGSLWE